MLRGVIDFGGDNLAPLKIAIGAPMAVERPFTSSEICCVSNIMAIMIVETSSVTAHGTAQNIISLKEDDFGTSIMTPAKTTKSNQRMGP
jgi:hypothetical protein